MLSGQEVTIPPALIPGSTLPYLDFNVGDGVQTGLSTCILSINSGNTAKFQIDLNGTTNGQNAYFSTLQVSTINGAVPGGGGSPRTGFALVAPGATTLTVNVPPPAAANGWNIVLTPQLNLGTTTYWAVSASTTSFVINLSAAAGGLGASFFWYAVAV